MLGPETYTDPNVLALCLVGICYLVVRALALYDRLIADGDGPSTAAETAGPR